MMLMQRSIAGGSIMERDLLLQYSIGEFYQELSLFLTEMEQKEKEVKKITGK